MTAKWNNFPRVMKSSICSCDLIGQEGMNETAMHFSKIILIMKTETSKFNSSRVSRPRRVASLASSVFYRKELLHPRQIHFGIECIHNLQEKYLPTKYILLHLTIIYSLLFSSSSSILLGRGPHLLLVSPSLFLGHKVIETDFNHVVLDLKCQLATFFFFMVPKRTEQN